MDDAKRKLKDRLRPHRLDGDWVCLPGSCVDIIPRDMVIVYTLELPMLKLFRQNRFAAALLAAMMLAVPTAPVQAQDQPTLLLNLTSDDVWTQQMALQFGRNFMNLTSGDLVIFLNVRAVGVGNAKVPQHTTALTGKTPQQLVTDLMADGARVFLCGGCTEQAGLSLGDRIDGVEPSGPELHQILAAPMTKVMSY